MNINLNPAAPDELTARIGEVIDAAVAREGSDYASVLASIYSMAALCNLDVRFVSLGEQLIAGIDGIAKDPTTAQKLTTDFNTLMRINFDYIIKHSEGKPSEPPTT